MLTAPTPLRAAALLAITAVIACQEGQKVPEEMTQDAMAIPATSAPATSARQDLLLATAMVALPPENISPADLPDPGSYEAKLVVQYCGQCHAIPAPAMHSASDWPSVVRRMWLRMERLPDSLEVAVPMAGDRVTLLRYLNANALRVSGATLPAGLGRDEFATVCSRCHALPDPRVHSPQDWPAVFMRMEGNMERMKVRPPTPEETSRILQYLQAGHGAA